MVLMCMCGAIVKQDEDEDWSRWRDVVFRAKAALTPRIEMSPVPPQNKRRRGGPVKVVGDTKFKEFSTPSIDSKTYTASEESGDPTVQGIEIVQNVQSDQLTTEEAIAKLKIVDTAQTNGKLLSEVKTEEMHYCPECYLPIHPDPKPERLYIFLHALKYTTSLGSFETDMPEWAAEGWEWDRT